MKGTRTWAWLTGGLGLTALVHCALALNNPYDSITARNSFALIPPTPPAPAVVEAPPANIKLTGITTWGGDTRGMLLVQDTSGPGKPDLPVTLRVGERDQTGVEMMEIDEKAGAVKVKQNGVVSALTFADNGAKAAAGPPPAMPGALTAPPPNQVLNPPRPGMPNPTTTAIEQPRPRGGLRQIPTRQLRMPQGGVAGGGAVGASAGNATGQPAAGPSGNPMGLTADEQLLLLHAAKEVDQPRADAGEIPAPPPIPPLPQTVQ